MKCVITASANTNTCTICGLRKQAKDTWFLITEDARGGRLHVWKWHQPRGRRPSPHAVCSPRHVRELVAHWMSTGCLSYPFATVRSESVDSTPQPVEPPARQASENLTIHLGEISVDRESMLRVLRDNPLSLNTILDELIIVLDKEVEEREAEIADDFYFGVRGT
jgi:hypothetical protein